MTTDGATIGGARIEVPPEQVRALGAVLTAQGEQAASAGVRLGPAPPPVGEALQRGVEDFLVCFRAATHALAGELHWLGGTVAAVADSWEGLDAGLLVRPGQAVPR